MMIIDETVGYPSNAIWERLRDATRAMENVYKPVFFQWPRGLGKSSFRGAWKTIGRTVVRRRGKKMVYVKWPR